MSIRSVEAYLCYIHTCNLPPRGPIIVYILNIALRGRERGNASRVQELVGQKKKLHISSFSCIIDELGRELNTIAEEQGVEARWALDVSKAEYTVKELNKEIMKKVQEVFFRHEANVPEIFVDDMKFKRLVYEMLDTRTAAVSSLRVYLEDPGLLIEAVEAKQLRHLHRSLVALREKRVRTLEGAVRRKEAEQLCVLQGLLLSHVNEVDEYGEGPLVRAAADGSLTPSRVKLFLDAGATEEDGCMAVMAAATYGREDAIASLITVLGAEVCVNTRNDKVRI